MSQRRMIADHIHVLARKDTEFLKEEIVSFANDHFGKTSSAYVVLSTCRRVGSIKPVKGHKLYLQVMVDPKLPPDEFFKKLLGLKNSPRQAGATTLEDLRSIVNDLKKSVDAQAQEIKLLRLQTTSTPQSSFMDYRTQMRFMSHLIRR